MPTKKTSSKPKRPAKQKAGGGCLGASCSASWNPPETAPKNETCIIANFGWPWPVMAIWCLVQEEWAIAQLAPCSEDDGRGWETEWEKGSSLIGWMPLPSLPNVKEHTPKGAEDIL
jgi:hypothetical protein